MQTKILHKMKRVLCATLFFLLLVVAGMAEAYAQTIGDLIYSLDNDNLTATVTGHVDGTAATGTLVIPESVNYEGTLYSVTSIGDSAFYNCSGFTGGLTIPNSVTSIGGFSFYGCSGLTSLTFDNSVTLIGSSAFLLCNGLVALYYMGDLRHWCCNIQFVDYASNPLYYAHNLYINNEIVTNLVIPSTVTEIKPYVFMNATCLTFLAIPNTVTSIGKWAFYGCSSFVCGLTIPNSVTSIGDGAFYGCSGFVGSLVIPNSVTSIGFITFVDCIGFNGSLTIPNSVLSIAARAFQGCSGFTGNLTIPNSVTSIGYEAFKGCTGFSGDLTIGNSVTSIGSRTFQGCSGFTGSLTIPNSVTSIGQYAFYGCTGFSGDLTIGNSVTSIGASAFCNCSNFTGSLTIPSSVASIGSFAFYKCSGFSEVLFNATNCADLSSTSYAFSRCGGSLVIGDNVQRIPDYMFDGGYFTGSLTIPNSVTSIGIGAFYNCSGFTGSLTIPSSVALIGSAAFYNCGFTEVHYNAIDCADPIGTVVFLGCSGSLFIGNNVERIPTTMFTSCSGFTGVLTIPSSVTSIGHNAFSGCSGFTKVVFNATNCADAEYRSPFYGCRGTLVIGENVERVPDRMFYNSNGFTAMNSYAIVPPSVGSSAFYGVNHDIPVSIPCGTLNAYLNTSGWNQFTNYQEDCFLEITAAVNPIEGGTVAGAGSFEEGDTCTLTATANPNYTFLNWTENGYQVSPDLTYSFMVTENRSLVANFIQNQPNTYIISTTVQPNEGGLVSGGGGYTMGSTCTLTALAAEGYFFQNWTKNGNMVSNNPTCSFVVTGNATYTAHFTQGLPELHVTDITHSEFMAGQQVTVSWTVQNDGTSSTPIGAVWHDRVWLSVESRVAAGDNNPILLGTFDNLSALDVGEYYTQTQTLNIPIDIVGEYYLFVLTDAYDCHTIYWDPTGVQLPYSPPPYIGCLSGSDNRIYELSEYEHGDVPGGFYNDNFFYTIINIADPLVPDLQVISVIPPNNFYSGTNVTVTATISNLGEVVASTTSWTDALFVALEPDISTATCIAAVSHTGILPVGSSYQVNFTGGIPMNTYGEAYFFVQTDYYEQVYEHVWNHNNIMMSEVMNIILPPPADLMPAEIVVPNVVSTAESFTYSYKVYNNGAGNPDVSNWQDKVYLSQNAETIGDNAMLLKTHSHYGGLQPGANYTVNETLLLPGNVASGSYYLYVVADAANTVFEYNFENNNLARSSMISVVNPNLQVLEALLPEQIVLGYPMNVSYTLSNEGEGAINDRNITDKIFLSASGTLADAIMLDSIRRNVNLPAGQGVTVMCNEAAPAGLTEGIYHLLIVTDYDDEIDESNEGDNSYTHYPMAVFHQPLPDLQPVSFSLPSIIQAGEVIDVDFDITNIGDLDLLHSNCAFDVYALQNGSEILCPIYSQTLPLGNYVSIGINDTLHFVRTITVPPTVTSACTTFKLVVNKGEQVIESDYTNNTMNVNATVLDCPLPDLTITDIVLPTLEAGAEAQVSYTVVNNGTAVFSGTFNTRVYALVDETQIYCPMRQQITPETTNYNLAIGESLQFTQKVLIPPMLTSACSTFSILVDASNAVLETNESNNTINASATVENYPFNLTIQAFEALSTITAGEVANVSWAVKNTGTCPSEQIPYYMKIENSYNLIESSYLPTPWKDKIYLSDDAELSDGDIQLRTIDHNTVLYPQDIYSEEPTIMLPYNAIGPKYLLCISDATQRTFDNNRMDNIAVVPIEVELGPLPDLHLTELVVEENLTFDNAYWVHYTVTNEGERRTQRDNWVDAFYISEAYAVTGAFMLSSKVHQGALEIGDSYTDSIEILAPNGLDGDYFLLAKTDATDLVFEDNNEVNNILGVPVTIIAPDPCDLVAVQPEFPAYVVPGEDMTVSWQLHNIGANPAKGRIRNAVYLSTDAAWSSDDKMLGYADIDINITPHEQRACSLSSSLTGIAEGNYYVIVKTNILNALYELSYENNTCVSLLTIEVGFPLLVIGEEIDRTLEADQYVYYKLPVGLEYEGQTLSCTLTTTEQQVSNGLYLSHETVPTLSQYDFGQNMPYAQEVEILIPALEQGDYYLLAKGSTYNGSSQQVNLATSIINFEILSIDADHGANSGSITTKVTGAKFDSIMNIRLIQGDDYLPANIVYFSNSTESYATFDLVDMPVGKYSMEAELPGGIITIKDDAFTIDEGLPAELAINIVAPSSVRNGNVFPVSIEYGNIGTTDLNVSGFKVVSRNGHPIGFSSEALNEGLTELTFDIREPNGNPNVIRPGYRNTKNILVKATSSTNISLIVYALRKH